MYVFMTNQVFVSFTDLVARRRDICLTVLKSIVPYTSTRHLGQVGRQNGDSQAPSNNPGSLQDHQGTPPLKLVKGLHSRN